MATAPRDELASKSAVVAETDVKVDGTMDEARKAYAKGDAEASKAVHDAKTIESKEIHGGAGVDYIKSIVFGGLDGIITTFAIVAAVAGANMKIEVIILMGFSNLIADAISMGLGDYLSTVAENDSILQERARETFELENYPEGERREMIEEYEELGFDKADATTIIDTYMATDDKGELKYREQFIDHMMVVELGQQVPDADDNPAWNGLITFISFIIFGSIPMWFYVIFYATSNRDQGVQFAVSCVATALTMFLLGFTKARIVRARLCNAVRQGLLMMLNGSLAAAAAYLIGWGLEHALGASRSECA